MPGCCFPAGAGRETHPTATGWSEQHKSGPLCGLVALPKNQHIREKSRNTLKINDLRGGFADVCNSVFSRLALTLTLSPRRGDGLRTPVVVPMRVRQILSMGFRACCGRFSLPMNLIREGNLLSLVLSSTSVWRRGRWNGAQRFRGSIREVIRGILTLRRGQHRRRCITSVVLFWG